MFLVGRQAEDEDQDDGADTNTGTSHHGDASSTLPLSIGLKAVSMTAGIRPDQGVNSISTENKCQGWKHRLSFVGVDSG